MSAEAQKPQARLKIALLTCAVFLTGMGLSLEPAGAEGRCPPGYYPTGGGSAGWEACAPMGPESSSEPDSGSDEDNSQPARLWEDRWGSVAIGEAALGAATDQISKEAAEKIALRQCRASARNNADTCSISLSYFRLWTHNGAV
jgi:hypothetical protein